MNRRRFLVATSAVSLIWVTGCTQKKEETGYWTCTMHPQVHQSEPGKCPICGMPLVHVDKKDHVESQTEETSGIEPTDTQLKNANISKYKVSKKDFLVTLSLSGRAISPREVSFQIYESDLGVVKPGIQISGYASTDPDTVMKGKISSVDTIVDPSSRTVRANAVLQSSVANFVAETSFYGQIQNKLKNQILIPEEAVLHAGKRDLVYLFTEDGKIQPQTVRLGLKSQGEYQVVAGLKEGDVISAGANFLIDSEAKIRGQ